MHFQIGRDLHQTRAARERAIDDLWAAGGVALTGENIHTVLYRSSSPGACVTSEVAELCSCQTGM
jgi:hypothetical protein